MFLSFLPVIGRLHPVLVHLPIGILLVGILLQWLHIRGKHQVSIPVIRIIFLAGAVCAWLSCLTGYTLSLTSDYDEGPLFWHMWMGIVLALTATVIYFKIHFQQTGLLYKLLSTGLLLFIFITGHLGGSLTHGGDYLTSAYSSDTEPATLPVPKITNVQEAVVYRDIIRPVLQKECYECHSVRRQKGKLRLDDSLHIMMGGKDGPAVSPGRADESELFKRLLLPKTDEHHMPKEKPSLKEDQINVIRWWITNGADFHKKAKDFDQSPVIRTSLLTFQNAKEGEEEDNGLVPGIPVEAASSKSIEDLKSRGVDILPMAQNSNYLRANFENTTEPIDDLLPLLAPLRKQLVLLKTGDKAVSDPAMRYIAECNALTSVQLTNAPVSDKGVAMLHSLTNLQSLNLVGTMVTAQGIISLGGLKKLRYLYLYRTGVSEKDSTLLKKYFPKTAVVIGGYSLPFIASDTVELKKPRGS